MPPSVFTRLFRSSKAITAMGTVAASALVLFGVPPEKQAAANNLVAAMVTLAGLYIVMTGHEDAAEKSNPTSPPPEIPIISEGERELKEPDDLTKGTFGFARSHQKDFP